MDRMHITEIDNPFLAGLVSIHEELQVLDTVAEDAKLGLHHQAHNCDKDNELGCDAEGRYLVQPAERQQKLHNGWTYACDEHLALVRFEFAIEINRRKMERDADEARDATQEAR